MVTQGRLRMGCDGLVPTWEDTPGLGSWASGGWDMGHSVHFCPRCALWDGGWRGVCGVKGIRLSSRGLQDGAGPVWCGVWLWLLGSVGLSREWRSHIAWQLLARRGQPCPPGGGALRAGRKGCDEPPRPRPATQTVKNEPRLKLLGLPRAPQRSKEAGPEGLVSCPVLRNLVGQAWPLTLREETGRAPAEAGAPWGGEGDSGRVK